MNDNTAKIYEKLDQQIRLLHLRWYWLRSLFASELRLELLNNSEPSFFRIVQDLLFENIELMIFKITEQSGKGKNQRLCVETLLNQIKPIDVYLWRELEIIKNKISHLTKGIVVRRHNANAHLNLEFFVNEKLHELPNSTVDEYDSILINLREFMHKISGRFNYYAFHYEALKKPSGLDALFMKFIKSNRYNELVKSKVIDSDDKENSKYIKIFKEEANDIDEFDESN